RRRRLASPGRRCDLVSIPRDACRVAHMPELVIDPICGMRIDPADAVATAERGGVTSYFCSTACRDAFMREPEVAGGTATPDVPLTAAELADRAGVPGDWIDRLVHAGL